MRPLSTTLARFVQDIGVVRGRSDEGPWHLAKLPDGTALILLRVLDAAGHDGDLSVSGPRTHALFKSVRPIPLALRIRFRPGGLAPFLGMPMNAIADRFVHAHELWGTDGAALCEALLAARSDEQRVHLVESALFGRAARTPESVQARLARRAIAALSDPTKPVRVEALASTLGVSDRHLRRAFSETVGIGPKTFARVARLHRALARMHGTATWTSIAADAGYYDQAHMIAEFRALVGTTPATFAREAATHIRW